MNRKTITYLTGALTVVSLVGFTAVNKSRQKKEKDGNKKPLVVRHNSEEHSILKVPLMQLKRLKKFVSGEYEMLVEDLNELLLLESEHPNKSADDYAILTYPKRVHNTVSNVTETLRFFQAKLITNGSAIHNDLFQENSKIIEELIQKINTNAKLKQGEYLL